ncbi:hypothetical protein BT69DRAFT_1293528 [Atractiella rhizophila]|nr:hypothetical protein BT69DRAFT_1293528 [Atractiella rhizophila]
MSNVNQLLKEIKYAEVERLGFYPNIAFSKICLFFVYFGIGLLDKSIELAESVLPTIKLFDFVVPEPIITQMENTVNGVRLTSKDPKEEPPRKSSKKLDISDIRRMVSDPNGKMIFLQPEGPMEPWMEDVMSGNFDPDIPVAEVPLEQMVGYMLDSKGPDGRKEFERFRKRMDEDPAFEQYNTEMVRRMGILPEEYFKSHGKKEGERRSQREKSNEVKRRFADVSVGKRKSGCDVCEVYDAEESEGVVSTGWELEQFQVRHR